MAPRLRLLVCDIDPVKPATTLGALMRWSHGRFAIASDSYLRLPLANHNLGNRAALVPIEVVVQPAPSWEIAVHTSYNADIVVLRDDGHIPLTLGVTLRVSSEFDLRTEAGWSRLLGPQHDVQRGITLVTIRWHRQVAPSGPSGAADFARSATVTVCDDFGA